MLLTGIDLPFEPSCGSLILASDLYSRWPEPVRFVGLRADRAADWSAMPVTLLQAPERPSYGMGEAYVDWLTSQLRAIIEQLQPSLFHLHHLSFGLASAWLQLRREASAPPTIALCHGTDLMLASASSQHLALVRQVLDGADHVVFPTRAMEALALTLHPDMLARRSIISWGIPPTPWRAPSPQGDGSPLVLLYAGRWTSDKGGIVALELMTSLERRGLPARLICLVQPHERPRIRAQVLARKLASRVELMDHQPRQALWSVFARAHALLIPSLQIEAFCLLGVEAMSCGLPVLYAGLPALKEVIGEAGVAVAPALSHEPDSWLIERWVDAVEALHQDDARRASLAAAGCQRARHYPIEATVHALASLSAAVLSGSRSRP